MAVFEASKSCSRTDASRARRAIFQYSALGPSTVITCAKPPVRPVRGALLLLALRYRHPLFSGICAAATRHCATGGIHVRFAAFSLSAIAVFALGTPPARSQSSAPANSTATTASVSRTTKAINYRKTSGSTKIAFRGTELLQSASGEAKVENKNGRIEIEAKFEGL